MYRYSRLYSYIHLFLGCSRIQDDQDGLQKKGGITTSYHMEDSPRSAAFAAREPDVVSTKT
jgi:hypothetical protein